MRYSIDTCNLTRKRVQSQVLPEVVALEIVIVEGADSLLQLRWELLVAHVLLVEHFAEWKLNRFIDSATIINLTRFTKKFKLPPVGSSARGSVLPNGIW